MDNNRIQANASAAYEQTSRVREQDRARLDQLLGGPGLVDPNQRLSEGDDDGLRPEDRFENVGAPVAPPPVVAPPQVGAAVFQDEEDVVLPLDGRGAAVALQEHLKQLLDQSRQAEFDATAEALGVQDKSAFQAAVSEGSALQSFAQVDSQRLIFTDSKFNEIDPDQLSAVAKAQLVIKPSYEVPVDVEVEAPEVALIDPNIRAQKALETPVDPTQQAELQQAQPEQLLTNDARPTFV